MSAIALLRDEMEDSQDEVAALAEQVGDVFVRCGTRGHRCAMAIHRRLLPPVTTGLLLPAEHQRVDRRGVGGVVF